MKRLLPVLLKCISLLSAIPALADQTIGLPADPGQGNSTPFGGYSGRYQQVYAGSAFSGIIVITSLQFFNTQSNSNATNVPSGNWTIALSTTSANWNTLSTNFAANVGADNAMVFSGNLSRPWAFGNTLTINLSKPFAYNPQRGNLLMDVNVSGVTTSGPMIFFDTTGYNGGARNGSTVVGHVDSDGVFSGYGLVTRFVSGKPYGGGNIALLTFLGLLAVWAALYTRRAKRAVS